jgi:hypothetical protein
MNTNNEPVNTITKLGPEADEMEHKVSQWFASAKTLIWVPIIDVENSPAGREAAKALAQELEGGWLIYEEADFLTLPEGIKGWLLPLDDEDTDVICGRWEREVTFMHANQRRTGELVTFLTDVEALMANQNVNPEAKT